MVTPSKGPLTIFLVFILLAIQQGRVMRPDFRLRFLRNAAFVQCQKSWNLGQQRKTKYRSIC